MPKPRLLVFIVLLVAKPRPTLATLLEAAKTSADQKIIEIERRQMRKSA
jgi:hypothetical protein